jgi:Ser/Thr protein kinase RdoA (MazF antagonist)
LKAFTDLTAQGKLRRLRLLALEALKAYELEVERVSLLGSFTNTLFRVRTSEGKSYVLRVCAPGWRTDTDLVSEVLWLQALDRETDLGAPVPLLARDGRALVTASVPGLIPCRCMLMSWIPGTPLGKRLTEENLEKMGMLHARMHAYGTAFQPPEGFTRRKMSSYLSRDEPEELFAASCAEAFTERSRAVFMEMRTRVQALLEGLYADPSGLRVIHDDLWHDNIKLDRGRLRPLDFEDTVWGYPVQDLAAAIEDLYADLPEEAFAPAVAALRRGYEQLAPWPERFDGEIDLLRAGRALWVANYVARFERDYLQQHLERAATRWEPLLE